MSNKTIWITHAVLLAIAAIFMFGASLLAGAGAATTDELSANARATLDKLYSTNSTAAAMGRSARAVLVFPKIIKAGLVARPYREFSGAYGEGALLEGGTTAGFYKLVSSTWEPQANTSTSIVVFLMTPEAEAAVGRGNWPIDAGAIVDETKMNLLATASASNDAHVFVFDQKGLVAATSLQGSKISQIKN